MRNPEINGVNHDESRKRIRASLVYNNLELISNNLMIPVFSGERLNGSAREEARRRIRTSLLEKSGIIYGCVPVCNGQMLSILTQEES